MEKEVVDLRRKLAAGGTSSAQDDFEEINGVKFSGKVVTGIPAGELKPAVDIMRQKIGSGVAALVGVDEGKISLVIGVTEDLTGKYNASALVKAISAIVGGKGGGRPDMAQAGGFTTEDTSAIIKAVKEVL